MPRQPRFNLPGYPQHVIQRGNNRTACFYEISDYRYYLDCLAQACERFGCDVHAYVLMTNHVHLLLTPRAEFAISQVMQSVGRRYVRYINKTYGRTGTLWEGRYKASLVDQDRYVLACYRYIELNPIRAVMVKHPKHYPWSSYHCNALGNDETLVTPHDSYLALGLTDTVRLRTYRILFRAQVNGTELDTIRHALNHELVLGNEQFKNQIEATTKRRARLGEPGRPLAH